LLRTPVEVQAGGKHNVKVTVQFGAARI